MVGIVTFRSCLPFSFVQHTYVSSSDGKLEEEIASAVPIDHSRLEEEKDAWLGGRNLKDALRDVQWSESDLDLHLHLPDALYRFSSQRFGPALEEIFLSSQRDRDVIVYSLIRTRDQPLSRELWIRLEEGEDSFAEIASHYGEGPEASRKGVIGPVTIGSLQPEELKSRLRSLSIGHISPPFLLGEWNVILKLEQLNPAQFDSSTRTKLLNEKLDSFLDERVNKCISGEVNEPIYYDS